MKNLTQTYRDLYLAKDSLEKLTKDYKREKEKLENEIKLNKSLIDLSENSIDIQKVQIAETIIDVSEYSSEGDQSSCIRDAIKQFSSNENNEKDLWKKYFATKNYSPFYDQRCDCEYGCSPSHGCISFIVALTRTFRLSEKKQSELTDKEIESVVYYLSNIKKIQKAKGNSK